MRELTANEVDLFVDQLLRAAASLAVVLGDIDEFASEETKQIITIQLQEIFSLLRDANNGDLTDTPYYQERLESYLARIKM